MRFLNPFKKDLRDLKEANTIAPSISFKASARSIRFKKELHGGSRETFEYPNMNLYEIARAVATDSYISESQNKYKEKIFKAGYYLDGEEAPLTYLKKRLSLISFMNETIFDITLQEVADDLIVFQNAYLLKLRVDTLPFVKAVPFIGEKVVGGYMRLDPCEIVIVKDKYNNILRYELEQLEGENKKINKQDIIHFYMNRKGTDKQGTPRLEPVLEDVKALRDIEGDVLTLIHRFCFPMYHIKVGLAQNGYTGTQTEIDNMKYEIENMTEDGMLITNEKIDIKTIGAEGNALDVKNYLEYFEKRIFSGLNTSESQMGRDSKTTPDSLEAQVHDSVKHIQRHLALFLQHEIFNELLLEGGFNPILNEDDRIKMIFNEISLDTRVKLENHEALKYQSNIQTLKETRSAIGKPEEVDETDLFVDNISNYAAGVQTEQKTDGAIALAQVNARLNPAQSESTNNNKKKTPDKANNAPTKKTDAVETKNRPQNQHGTYSVKIKEALEKTQSNQEKSQDLVDACYKIYNRLGNEANEKAKTDELLLVNTALECIFLRLHDAEAFALTTLGIDVKNIQEHIEKCVKKDFKKLFKELNEMNTDRKAYRIKFIIEYWSKKYFWYCYCLIQKQEGIKMLYIKFNRPEEAENRKKEIHLASLFKKPLGEIISLLPPFHPYCQCRLEVKKTERSS